MTSQILNGLAVTDTASTETASGAAGHGDVPALLLIPGWCGDRTVFDPLLTRSSEDVRAIAVDLPDHGESPGPGSDFGTADVVEALVGLVTEAGLTRVVPVALSHAGWAAIGLRRRLGADVVPGVALLDWMVLGPPPGFLDALAALQSPVWEQVRRSLFDMWTAGVDHREVHAYVGSMGEYGATHWSRAGREVARSFAATPVPLEVLEAMQPCPTLHLYAQPADDAYLRAQQAYAAEHHWFRVQRLSATSHFPTFETPDEMVAALEAFVRRLV